MYSPYRGRCHTKKQNNLKPRLIFSERKKRAAEKKLANLFPHFSFHKHQHYQAINATVAVNNNCQQTANGHGDEARKL